MDAEDLVAMYAAQAKASMEAEANKRLEASLDPEEEERLSRSPMLPEHHTSCQPCWPAWHRSCCADGHGGGIKVTQHEVTSKALTRFSI